MDDLLYFRADDGVHGTELWRSDGTEAGTWMVKEINPGAGHPGLANFREVDGALFFMAWNAIYSYELWKSDGTEDGTLLVKDINPSGPSYPAFLTDFNGTLFLSARDAIHGQELWRTDGTEVGTYMVKDINPFGHAYVYYPTVMNGMLFFSADDGIHGRELWKTDGTTQGTVLVKDINPGASGSNASGFVEAGGWLYFTADDGVHGRWELWRTDGTEAGTQLVVDLNPGGDGFISGLTAFGDKVVFNGEDGTHGQEMWCSDGTTTGTYLIEDINPGANSSNPASFFNLDGTLYFAAEDDTHGRELWKTDGTAAGTALVRDIYPGPDWSIYYIPSFMNIEGTLYLRAEDGVHGMELWRSDGSESGTIMVSDIWPGSGTSAPSLASYLNDTLYLVANDGVSGIELWSFTPFDDDVVLFSTNSAILENRTVIHSGSVFVNDQSSTTDTELTVGRDVITAADYVLKADSITIDRRSVIEGDVYYNDLINAGIINGTAYTPIALPLYEGLPPFHEAYPGQDDIVIPENGYAALVEGAYGKIEIKGNGTLDLTGGEYDVQSITMKDQANLVFLDSSEVRVQENILTKELCYIGSALDSDVGADEVIFYVGRTEEKAIEIGKASVVHANFYVPEGELVFKNEVEATGAFLARDIQAGKRVQFNLDSFFDVRPD
jgi:ELWxxDGT repeat protein